jgi:hypothetical protein
MTAQAIAVVFMASEGSNLFRRPPIEEDSILGDDSDHSAALLSPELHR